MTTASNSHKACSGTGVNAKINPARTKNLPNPVAFPREYTWEDGERIPQQPKSDRNRPTNLASADYYHNIVVYGGLGTMLLPTKPSVKSIVDARSAQKFIDLD
jgi:hypothetical protein